MIWIIWFLNILPSFLATLPNMDYSIRARNETLLVQKGQNAVLSWVMVSYPSTNQTVKCTATNKNIVIATGSYQVANRRFGFTIPQDSQTHFNYRLHGVVYVQPRNSNMLTLTIENSIPTDSDKYICTYGQKSSEVNLQVYSELIEMGKPVKSLFLDKHQTSVSVELCATPEPRVTMELMGVVNHVKGISKPNSNCYDYFFRNLTLPDQKYCGQDLKLEYKGVKKSIRRRVKLLVPLSARAPTNVQVIVKDDGECPVVRWDGPNIGSCVTNSLAYDIIIYKHNRIVRRLRSSSNLIEACGINFLKKEITVEVRNTLGNTNSTWSLGSLVLDEKTYDGMQTAIIACTGLVALLIVLLSAYCFYRHKFSISRYCKGKKSLLDKSVTEEDDEIEPLNNTQTSVLSPKQESQPPEPHQKPEKESKRKTSRKISLDTFLHDHHTPRKNSAGAAEQNKVKPKPNHNTRFYSLQRNIERERKKLEEEELEQQLDEMYTKRRNTDSKVFEDFKNNLNKHHFGPRDEVLSHPTAAPGSPLYDTLPSTRSSSSNTRSSASTASTGRSYHEDDERPLPPARRRNTTENSSATGADTNNVPLYDILPRTNSNIGQQPNHVDKQYNDPYMPSDANGTIPLYDVLPRTNSNIAQQVNHVGNNKPYAAINDGTVYDYVPSVKTKDRNGHTPAKDGIYDVPVRPIQQTTEVDAKAAPFSSHRKQNRYNDSELYENR